jgi:hypothetical protein
MVGTEEEESIYGILGALGFVIWGGRRWKGYTLSRKKVLLALLFFRFLTFT